MRFDFDTFSKVVDRVYREHEYSKEEVLFVFREYFQAYEDFLGSVHPNIRVAQIKRIIEVMPFADRFDEEEAGYIEIDAEAYREIIAQHFVTVYNNCDYNINHFFSGKIRSLRYYETLY